MAINVPSPQQQERVQLQGTPNTRVQGTQAPQINTQFLNTISQRVDEETRMALRQRAQNLSQIRNQYSNRATEEVIRAKAEFATLQGTKAIEGEEKYLENLREKLSAIRSDKQFSNLDPEARKILELEEGKLLNNFRQTAIPHAVTEASKLRKNASEQYLKNQTEMLIEQSSNTEEFKKGIQTIKQNTLEQYIINNGNLNDPNSVRLADAAADKMASEAIKGAIAVQATRGAVTDAQKIFDDNRADILEADVPAIQRSLTQAKVNNDTSIALEIKDRALEIYPDDEIKREKFIKASIPDGPAKGDIYQKAISMSAADSARIKRQQQKVRKEKFRSSMTAIERFVDSGNQIPSTVFNALEPEDKSRAFEYAKKYAEGIVTTKPKVYRYLKKQWREGNSQNIDLADFRDQLSPRDRNRLETLWKNEAATDMSEERRVKMQTHKNYYDVLDQYMRYTEATKNYIFSDEEQVKLEIAFEEAFSRIQDSGMKPQQIKATLRKALMDSAATFKPTGTDDFIPFNEGVAAEISDSLVIDTAGPGEAAAQGQVHPKWRGRIEAYILRNNMEISEDLVRKMAESFKRQGFNLTEPPKGR